MKYIHITKENIDKEHICCAMSGKQALAKKEWLKQRFDEGLVFYRSEERGKCFIEYIPAENAWVPIEAGGWLYINCLWVSGSLKGHGYSSELLSECIRDAKEQGKKGICILCAEGRKREFLADPKFLKYKGFKVADISDCGINLMYLSLAEDAEQPRFKECARHPKVREMGFVLYARNIRRLRKLVLSSITPTSALSPIIGCRRYRRQQRNTGSHFKQSTSPTKKPRRMYQHRSPPMPCSGMESF